MSEAKIELIVHPLCPYAQRALYTSSFKSIPVEIIHVSTAEPEPWFLELNPLGEVPALRITHEGRVSKLTESLNISEYFDSFPGPSLYPRQSDEKVDALEKGIIDVFIKLKVGGFANAVYSAFFWQPSQDEVKTFKDTMAEFNGYFEGGQNVLHNLLRKNDFTFADIMILPFVERLNYYKEFLPEELKTVDFSNIFVWFERVYAQDWVQPHKVSVSRLLNEYKHFKTHGYVGLKLPLTVYDE